MKLLMSLIGLVLTCSAWAGTPPPLTAIIEGDSVKFFAPNANFNDVVKFLTGSDDPTVIAKNAPAGSLYLRSTGSVYCKTDSGLSTHWTLLASSTATVTSVGLTLPSDVFAVSGSPVTSAGSLVGSFNTQNANLVFAGPANGSAATPTFRLLDPADIPSLGAAIITSGKGSISTSTPGVVVGSGANSTLGPNVTVDVQTASGVQAGLLAASDFTT